MSEENNSMEVKIDDTGIIEFINCVNEKSFTKEKIAQLFECTGYRRLVDIGGANIGVNSNEEWINIFYEALNFSNDKIESLSNECLNDFLKYNIYKTVNSAARSINKLKISADKIISEINSKAFIDVTRQFIKDRENLNEITINLVVFMDNCFAIGDQMILDVQFLGKVDNETIRTILAHELHHMLREKFVIDYKFDTKYRDISRILHWLESEGIADMCSLHITGKKYEDLGFIEKGDMEFMFNNVDSYLSKINDMFFDILNDKPYDKKFYNRFVRRSAYHPVGNTMARRIKDILGVEVLKECVGDKLRFLLEYQRASKQAENIFSFNIDVIEGIKRNFLH